MYAMLLNIVFSAITDKYIDIELNECHRLVWKKPMETRYY